MKFAASIYPRAVSAFGLSGLSSRCSSLFESREAKSGHGQVPAFAFELTAKLGYPITPCPCMITASGGSCHICNFQLACERGHQHNNGLHLQVKAVQQDVVEAIEGKLDRIVGQKPGLQIRSPISEPQIVKLEGWQATYRANSMHSIDWPERRRTKTPSVACQGELARLVRSGVTRNPFRQQQTHTGICLRQSASCSHSLPFSVLISV